MARASRSAGDHPLLILIAKTDDGMVDWRSALERARWQVELSSFADVTESKAWSHTAALVLITYVADRERIQGMIDLVRQRPYPPSSGPILCTALAAPQPHPLWSGIDLVLDGERDPQAIARALEPWKPFSLAPTRRIAAMLGSGPIAGMIERLGRRLEAALDAIDQGRTDTAEAHRLAGLCGTLGFAQAHAAWLDLSQGDASARNAVRRTTRLTLAAIAEGL